MSWLCLHMVLFLLVKDGTKFTNRSRGQQSYQSLSHRPITTKPVKLTAIVMHSASPPAMLAGAWPVNDDGEGGEVELLDVDPIPERTEGLESAAGPPTGKHNSFTRARISAATRMRRGKVSCRAPFSEAVRQKNGLSKSVVLHFLSHGPMLKTKDSLPQMQARFARSPHPDGGMYSSKQTC